jgi:hypothetical protein
VGRPPTLKPTPIRNRAAGTVSILEVHRQRRVDFSLDLPVLLARVSFRANGDMIADRFGSRRSCR